MKLAVDEYCYLKSPIHNWEQKTKLIALLTLIFAFAFVEKIFLLPWMIAVTIVLFILSRLPLSFLLSRLRYPSFFIVAVIVFLPFLAGNDIIFQWGFLAIKAEGCLQVLIITTRFICILTVSIILFGTAPFLTSIKAMRSLGLSVILVDMIFLSYRYLYELNEMLITMQRAIKLRGFQPHKFSYRNLNIISKLIGSVLIRSYDKSQRVYQAMILRGYGNTKIPKKSVSETKINQFSKIASALTLLIAIVFFSAEIIFK